jgi:sugar diacid utilization regulator
MWRLLGAERNVKAAAMGVTGEARARQRGSEHPTDAVDRGDWLTRAALGASHDAGDVSEEFLGDYLPMLAAAATSGQRPTHKEVAAVRQLGRRAAQSGISAGRGVDLYLSAARRVWGELPAIVRARNSAAVRAAADAVLHVVDDAVASFAEGHAEAGRELVRQEVTLRRALVEDLLRGDAHVGELVERAEPFGLDLTRAHSVALARPARQLPSIEAATSALERVVLDRFGDRDVLVATKEGLVVVLALADVADRRATAQEAATSSSANLGNLIHAELSRLRRGGPWRVVVGRPHPGAYGIARSYEEAREGLTMSARMQIDDAVVQTKDLLIYRVLSRDQPALVDLIGSVLGPLEHARGGARPLLDTLEAYFGCGNVATASAAKLHLSVRAVTYRLDRVTALTGYDPGNPKDRFTLQTAVLGAKLLGWPELALASADSAS